MTDFGIPKVIGGNFNMLATDVFKLVIGQQDFQRGAVVGLLLLTPAVLTFGVDWLVQRKQTAMLTARAVPLRAASPRAASTALMFAYCVADQRADAGDARHGGLRLVRDLLAVQPDAEPASTTRMGLVDAEVGSAFVNSLKLAAGTAFFGTIVVFVGAYMLEKTRGIDALRPLVRLLAMLPMAVPGLVLGLGYIFFFNAPGNPLHGLYQTMALLVALHHRPLLHHRPPHRGDGAEVARRRVRGGVARRSRCRSSRPSGASPCRSARRRWSTSRRYFFVNAMTTISAVVFLYSPDTKVAAIAILNLDEAGEAGAAAACAMLITAASTVVTLLFMAVGALIDRRTQAWRRSSTR